MRECNQTNNINLPVSLSPSKHQAVTDTIFGTMGPAIQADIWYGKNIISSETSIWSSERTTVWITISIDQIANQPTTAVGRMCLVCSVHHIYILQCSYIALYMFNYAYRRVVPQNWHVTVANTTQKNHCTSKGGREVFKQCYYKLIGLRSRFLALSGGMWQRPWQAGLPARVHQLTHENLGLTPANALALVELLSLMVKTIISI